MKKKDIIPRNGLGEKDGYWETYWSNGNVSYKGNYKDGIPHGYWEEYWYNGNLSDTGNYVNGRKSGYWELYDSDGELEEQIFYA